MAESRIGNGRGPSLTSTAVSDAMQKVGLDGVLGGLTAYGDSVVAGTAFTVRLCGPERSEQPFNAYLDEVPEGSVVVIDSGGLRGFSVFGGLMCAEARRRGAVAAVVRGEVRDAAQARQMGFGLFALGLTPRSGRPLARLESTGVSIDWDGVPVRPGDTVVGDEDGVVAIPARHAETVIGLAAEIETSDEALLREVESGVPLAAAREALARGAGG
jgi:regulator of RNase E activity RraA